MMPSRVTGHLKRGGGVLLTILTLEPNVSRAAEASPVPDLGSWLLGISLFGLAGLALLTVLFVFGDAGERRRRRTLRGQLGKLSLPAAISRVSGKLDWSNQAMRTAFGDDQGDIMQTLGQGIKIDAGQIYRLVGRAREIGFAFEPVRSQRQDSMAILSVRVDGPKHLVWMVIPPEQLSLKDGKTGFIGFGLIPAVDRDMGSRNQSAVAPDDSTAKLANSATLDVVAGRIDAVRF